MARAVRSGRERQGLCCSFGNPPARSVVQATPPGVLLHVPLTSQGRLRRRTAGLGLYVHLENRLLGR